MTDELTGDSWPVASLAPGASEEFTAEYIVTEDDILAGEVLNVATATGTSPDPDDPDPEIVPGEDPEPTVGHMTITKATTSTAASSDGKYALDETITYKITVTNDGKVTLTDVKVTDELTGDEWNIASLAAGESKEYTTTYTVTEADILAGEVLNVATATAKDPDGNDPEIIPGEDPEPTEDPDGHMTITKETTSTAASGDGKYALGETITYKITALNDGNLTLTDITVTDELTGDSWPVAKLAPGASEEFETSYTVTEDDILAGEVVNVATATGTSPDPDDPDPEIEPGEDPEPTADKDSHLTLEKETTSTPADANGYASGETITYQITATNDGNVTISNITVTDDLTGDSWPVASLAPGESQTFTTSYTVTDADAAAGSVLNVATATGVDPEGEDPDVVPGEDPEPTIPNPPAPVPPAPNPPAPVIEEAIAPNPTPMADTVDVIEDDGNPLGNGGAWSLVDLLLSLGTLGLTGKQVAGLFRRKKDDEEEPDGTQAVAAATEDDEEQKENKHSGIRAASVVPAVGTVALFLLTQDLTQPMTLIDAWTPAFAGITAVDGIMTYASRRRKNDDDDDAQQAAPVTA